MPYEDGTNRGFQNFDTFYPHAGELPKRRKYSTFQSVCFTAVTYTLIILNKSVLLLMNSFTKKTEFLDMQTAV
jgi:hypothetical protein